METSELACAGQAKPSARLMRSILLFASIARKPVWMKYIHEHLVRSKRPVIQVMAKSIGNGADKATSEQAGNLAGQFPVCIGARLMLTRNICPSTGLINAAQGTVYDMDYVPGADTHCDPPCVILTVHASS